MANIVLASTSPRRKELMEKLQVPFQVVPSLADEHIETGMGPDQAVIELSVRKAMAVAGKFPDSIVIGADTVVAIGGAILGKPRSREEAGSMLRKLSGRTHEVHTGVTIVTPQKTLSFNEKTEVAFWELSEREIECYLDSGEPYDKAGAYGIQGFGALLVKSIHGDYYSVVGLPVARLSRALHELGFSFDTLAQGNG